MILTDREIKHSLAHGLLRITPAPASDRYASTSVDLTLSNTIRSFKAPLHGMTAAIDPSLPNYNVSSFLADATTPHDISADGFVLKEKTLVLGWTTEVVGMPVHSRVAARVEGKSSLARIGLAIHITAPTIHAGFDSNIQLEIINHGPFPILLKQGMAICQLIFEQTLGIPEKGYSGQFASQSPQSFSK